MMFETDVMTFETDVLFSWKLYLALPVLSFLPMADSSAAHSSPTFSCQEASKI